MTIAALLFALIATTNADGTREPTLLDFHASWCGPCQQMRPVVEQLRRSGYPVKSIDTERSADVAERYEVSRVPTFIVVDASGRELARTEGLQPAGTLAGFYRSARAKVLRAAPPAPKDEDDEADHDVEDAPAPRPQLKVVNPDPWKTVVRIKIHGNGSIGFGSGTIIYSTPAESIILTCAHIFKLEGPRQAAPSRFPRRIAVDLFDGQLRGQQVHYAGETVEGEAIDYDFGRDVGLIRIRPGRRLPASHVVPASYTPKPGTRVTTVGCSEGRDATAWSTSILKSGIHLFNNSNYEAVECAVAPSQGRSGGGLYTADGYVAGVCDFAEPRGNHGFYATPRSIHWILDHNQLTALYNPDSRKAGAMVAQNGSARRASGGSIARLQSPERDESKEVTMPSPEIFGIKAPAVAMETPRKPAGRHPWQTPKSDSAERTDLELPSSLDNDRFGAPVIANPQASEDVAQNSSTRHVKSRWRAVKLAPALSAVDGN